MILVTGASGMLGRHLVRQLAAGGLPVRAQYRSAPPQSLPALPGVEWRQADLLDIIGLEELFEGIDRVYHCAAMVSFHPADEALMMQVNIDGTANLVNQALESDVRKLVHVSSVAALGKSEGGAEIGEAAQWEENRFTSRYGLSKFYGEMEVWRGIGEGLDAVIVNPGIILGGGDWTTGSAALMAHAARNFPFYTDGVTSFTGVGDVAEAMRQLMDSDVSAERFIISNGNFAYREVLGMMSAALGTKPAGRHAGPLLTGLLWRMEALRERLTGKKSVITRETAQSAQAVVRYAGGKLERFLTGFRYRPLEDTVRDMAEQFLTETGGQGSGR